MKSSDYGFISKMRILVAILGIWSSAFALDYQEDMPPFRLPGVDGNIYDSREFKKSELLAVVFLSNHCPTSQIFQHGIISLAKEYRNQGLQVIAISPNDPEAILPDELSYSVLGDTFSEMVLRSKELQYPFPYLYDGKTQEVSKSYGVRVTPHAYLFDKNRKLRYSGRIGDPKNPDRKDRDDLRHAIISLIHGTEPVVVRGLAYGNSIKWIKDRIIVEKARSRFSRESVYLKKSNSRTLQFVRRNISKLPTLIYVWSIKDMNNRQDLLKLASIHKIYRKRGLKFVTICVDGKECFDAAKKVLVETQSSGTNYISTGTEISPVADLRSEEGFLTTPFLGLLTPEAKVYYRSNNKINSLIIKRNIIKIFNLKN
ncbi:MAG: thioredoxin family protein [Opitutae bacterium]|nr:thioredoxin family protein [Opitutae bacterium]